MKAFDHDVAILGGGSAGYAAAQSAAALGLRVVVMENGAKVGGLCILRGCMPTKSLLYAAEVMHLAKHSGKMGRSCGQRQFRIRGGDGAQKHSHQGFWG